MNWTFWLVILMVILVLGKCFTLFVFPRIMSRWFTLNHQMTTENGYIAAPDLSSFQGCEGSSFTDLRPSGKADIAGKKIDVSIRHGYVKKGTRIRVIEICAGTVYVEPIAASGQKAPEHQGPNGTNT